MRVLIGTVGHVLVLTAALSAVLMAAVVACALPATVATLGRPATTPATTMGIR